MSAYEVALTRDAERDLEDIYEFIAHSDSETSANNVLRRLIEAAEHLRTQPERGSHPKELQSLGLIEYRQVLFKPYRLICRIYDRRIVVFLIADGRRDMQSLLTRRLFAS